MSTLKLGFSDDSVITLLNIVLENHFVLALLLDDINDEESSITRHQAEIFLGVEGQEAPLVPLADTINQPVRHGQKLRENMIKLALGK